MTTCPHCGKEIEGGEQQRQAALARWGRTPAAERSERARAAARVRWKKRAADEQKVMK